MKKQYGQYAIDCYLDYFNNYLTIAGFAESYGYTFKTAYGLIMRGRELYNSAS